MSNTRTTNYDWYIENNFNEYASEWIAIINKRVVGHEKNIKTLIKFVQDKYHGKKPAITKVEGMHKIL
ncbi:hypothetical protein HZB00_01270 [Candidatus Woesearchaeota archaeon]|nr:hypothetical protein [Candidatus Woesearchaeota archaeon]